MAIPVIKVSAMPSVNMLSNLDSLESLEQREERHAFIRSSFARRNGNDYFGSAADRYYESFANTIRTHVDRIGKAARRLRDAFAVVSTENIIRPCVTERSLRNLPPVMYEAVLSLPDLYYYFRRRRVQGWGELTPDDIKPKVGQWKRLIDVNGKIEDPIRDEDQNKEQHFKWTWTTDDPCLTVQQIWDIRATRDYVQSILDGTELDPTDLDEARS